MTLRAYGQGDLARSLAEDRLLPLLAKHPEDGKFASHEWLMKFPAKRMIWDDLYGDLLEREGLRILDVGGGYSALTRELARRHDYTLLDIMAHDAHEEVAKRAKEAGFRWDAADWKDAAPEDYDLVIANDLFPNVDQRLEAFLAAYRPRAGALRFSLTAYDTDRFYKVKRVDADEVLFIRPWGSAMLSAALSAAVPGAVLPALPEGATTLFSNGRAVYRLFLP